MLQVDFASLRGKHHQGGDDVDADLRGLFREAEMSDAVLDGDFARCVDLADRGNWPIDGMVELLDDDDNGRKPSGGLVASGGEEPFQDEPGSDKWGAGYSGLVESYNESWQDRAPSTGKT